MQNNQNSRIRSIEELEIQEVNDNNIRSHQNNFKPNTKSYFSIVG